MGVFNSKMFRGIFKRPIIYLFISIIGALFLMHTSFKFSVLIFILIVFLIEKTVGNKAYKITISVFFILVLLYFIMFSLSYKKEISYDYIGSDICGFVSEIKSYGVVLDDCLVDGAKSKFKFVIYTDINLDIGDEIIGKIKYKSAGKYYNDGSFNIDNYNKAKRIVGNFYPHIYSINKNKKYFIKRALFHYRNSIANTLRINMNKNADVLIAMLLGISSDIDMKNIRVAGIIHIFAISGLHLAIISKIIYIFSSFITPKIKYKSLITILFVVLYTIMTGAHISTIRAAIMILIYLFGNVFVRAYDKTTALMLAFIVIVINSPYSLLDVGFLLSFSAVIGIFYISDILFFANSKNEMKCAINTIVAVWIAILPVVAFSYYTVNTYSIITNFLILPLVPIIIVLGLFGVILPTFLSKGVLFIASFLIDYIMNLSGFIARLPYSEIFIGKVSIFFVALYFLLLYVYYKNKKAFVVCTVFVIAFVFVKSNKPFELTFLDIDNGDCAVIRDGREVCIIDGGGIPFKEGKNQGLKVLLPYIKYSGINKVDNVIVTHSDFDHIYGIIEIIGEVKICNIILSDFYKDKDVYLMNELKSKASKYGVKIKYAKDGDYIDFSSGKIIFYTPYKNGSDVSYNKASLMSMLKIHKKRFLFLGDCEKEEEVFLVENHSRDIERLDVLKVAHHGSKSSSDGRFLKFARPSLAVISAGRNNRFNHPHSDVVKRLKTSAKDVLVTARRGQIKVFLNKDRLKYSTYLYE